MLENLLSNACKFTTAGQVRLRIERHQGDAVALRASRTPASALPPTRSIVIFEAFRQADGSTQRRFGGTGLGLSISRELARLLGGELTRRERRRAGQPLQPRRAGAATCRRRQRRHRRTPARSASPTAITASATIDAPARHRPPLRVSAIRDDRGSLVRPDRLLLIVEDDAAFAGILYDLAHELDFDGVVATTADEGFRLATRAAAQRHPARRRPARPLGPGGARPAQAQSRHAPHSGARDVGRRLRADGARARRGRLCPQAGDRARRCSTASVASRRRRSARCAAC